MLMVTATLKPGGRSGELTFVYYDSRAELGVYAQAAQASLKRDRNQHQT